MSGYTRGARRRNDGMRGARTVAFSPFRMKPLTPADERGTFSPSRSHEMRSVTVMFDSVISWFTPERRARVVFPLEIALGAWLALAILLNHEWWGGVVIAALNLSVAIAAGVGIALHRRQPAWALLTLAPLGGALLLASATSYAFAPLTIIAGAVVVFGASAYGQSAARWTALAGSILAAATLFFIIIISSSDNFVGGYLGYILGQALWLLLSTVIALLPWLLGELVRSIRNRRALSATVTAVSTQRDAALTRADLEAERTRVARDVHDIVAHSLTVVIAQADGARYATASDSPAAADAFETIAQTARDALGEVRVLLTELRHTQEAGPQPGVEDVGSLLAAMRDSGLALEFTEFGARGELTDTRALALYRILQEALTNALRHGDRSATVELEWGATAVDLTVTNRPSDAARHPADSIATDNTGGHGIDGMRERAALAGGELAIHSGDPFRVRARLPLTAADDTSSSVTSAQVASSATTEVLS